MNLETCLTLQRAHARAAQRWRLVADNLTDPVARRACRKGQRESEQSSRMWLKTIRLMLVEPVSDQPDWGSGHGGEG